MRLVFVAATAFSLLAAGGCGGRDRPTGLATFPMDELGEIVEPAGEGIWIDRETSADGNGSLCVEAGAPRIVRLFEVPVARLAGREIVCTARMRSLVLRGWAFPELWARVPGRDEFASRDPRSGVSRSTAWKDVAVALTLDEGLAPDRVRVNLVIEGAGRVWIDDVRLTAGPPGAAVSRSGP